MTTFSLQITESKTQYAGLVNRITSAGLAASLTFMGFPEIAAIYLHTFHKRSTDPRHATTRSTCYPESEQWALQWVDRIGNLYHLNALRLNASPDTPERISAQMVLEQAVQQMATDCSLGVANHELFPPAAKVLQSMTAHWGGLTVFVACPWVDIDNNQAERSMRSPVIGRKNFNGSGCEACAELAATMYSLFATMKLWGLNLRTWLTTYLQACADNGNESPANIEAFLPWQMDAQRLAQMRACHPQEVLNRS